MISARHLTKRFGAIIALDDVSLEITPGERVAFIGANGSGKTTLLRALLGLVRVGGRITIGATDVARAPELALRHIAYIPQIAPPIEAPVAEVVRAHASLRERDEREIERLAARLGLDLSACRAKRFRDLSGGMKQKLLAAMALSTGAPILACDEPTANLDADAREAFFEMVGERPADTIVVLSSHRAEEVHKLVGRAVALADGRVVQDGPLGSASTSGALRAAS